jgi:molybdopterin synthase sulfur carrier subunit
MRLAVMYFAGLREALGLEQEWFDLESRSPTVAVLRAALMSRGPLWAQALGADTVQAAVNHTHARPGTPLAEGDEVAFFPPVTGG